MAVDSGRAPNLRIFIPTSHHVNPSPTPNVVKNAILGIALGVPIPRDSRSDHGERDGLHRQDSGPFHFRWNRIKEGQVSIFGFTHTVIEVKGV